MITNIVLTVNNDTNLGMFWFITQFLKPGIANPILCILKQWEQPINNGKWSDQSGNLKSDIMKEWEVTCKTLLNNYGAIYGWWDFMGFKMLLEIFDEEILDAL